MEESQAHLCDNGRVLVNFGTSGDLDYLLALIDRNGFNKEVVSEWELVRDGWSVSYYVFRLTRTHEQAPKAGWLSGRYDTCR